MRRFLAYVLRGVALILPPLLTLLILGWAWATMDTYLIAPLRHLVARTVVEVAADIRTIEAKAAPPAAIDIDGERYVHIAGQNYVPAVVYDTVEAQLDGEAMPRSARRVYQRYVETRWLKPYWFVPASVGIVLAAVYLIGGLANRGLGRLALARWGRLVERLPFVRRVHSAIKQVTDHVVRAPELEFTRVVAVEYPRRGVWCVAYVVNEGLYDVAEAAQEPILTVFLDTSPIPFTGYTAMVKRSQTVPLNITMEDAVRYVLSCGIIVPPHQHPDPGHKAASSDNRPPMSSKTGS